PPDLTYHNISAFSAHNACVLFCKCKDRSRAGSFINMGIGPTAWLEVYLSQCAIENIPIIVTLLPSLWRKIKSIPSPPTSPVLGFFQSGGLRIFQ
ncbi:hypothetical protein CROQUDRAFT_654956, partial [Cronartium quercuum f. sp. fusiforme G11]